MRRDRPEEELASGMLLDGVYRVGECIGRGASGAVYVVEHTELGKRFAAKVLQPDAALDEEAVRRLRLEARAASAVDHENIVDVSHLGVAPNGAVFVVMEYLQGEDLASRLASQALDARHPGLPDAEVQALASQILSGLEAAHRAGVVHRDLKPANVFLARKGDRTVVKLVDFGLSKVNADRGGLRITRAGEVFGTPLYMSPEQCRSASNVDHRTDLYSFGIMLFEMTTGRLPFVAHSLSECVSKHLEELPPRPTHVRADLPPGVEAVILRCLEKRPEDRFGSAGEALAALRAGWAGDSAALADTAGSVPPAGAPLPRRWPLVAAAAVLLLFGAWAATRAAGPAAGGSRAAPPPPLPSPLAVADAVLACPLLEVEGVEAPTGWLGAAAAAITCERARVLLGGRYERTLVPAELLGFPRTPSDTFAEDPYGTADARERSVEEARRRGAAWVDGKVAVAPAGLRVSLALKRPAGEVVAQGEGAGRTLLEAIRAAMTALQPSGALPVAAALDPELARWTQARSVAAALAQVDLRLAHRQLSPVTVSDCAGWGSQQGQLGSAWDLHTSICNTQMGLDDASGADRAAVDLTSAPALVHTALRGLVSSVVELPEPPRLVAELERHLAAEQTPLGRSVLAATASCFSFDDVRKAQSLAQLAVEAHPRSLEALPCEPWYQMTYVTQMSVSSIRAVRAWYPWHAEAWRIAVQGTADGLRFTRRAFLLAPFKDSISTSLVERLVEAGLRTDARSALSALANGAAPQRLHREVLLVYLDAGEGRFGRAFEQVRALMVPAPGDTGAVFQARFLAARDAIHLARVLGREAEWSALMWQHYFSGEVKPEVFRDPSGDLAFATGCLYLGKQRSTCLARLAEHEAGRRFLNRFPEGPRVVAGVRRLAAGDVRGAVAEWRPLVVAQFAVGMLRDEMVDAFERTGEPDLARRLDAMASEASPYNGASLTMVRDARRAAARGQRDEALSLARKVIDAWSVADVEVPAVVEMRALVARLEQLGPGAGR